MLLARDMLPLKKFLALRAETVKEQQFRDDRRCALKVPVLFEQCKFSEGGEAQL